MILSSCLVALAAVGMAQGPRGAVKIDFTKPVDVSVASTPVTYHGNELSIVTLGQATFVKEDFRMCITELPKLEVPPGVYGVRWGHMPPTQETVPHFNLEFGPFLSVKVKASVAQYNRVDYRISCAVFDKDWKLLGTASQTEEVQYVRLGQMPVVFRELTFDLGSSKAFAGATYAVFSVSEPVVPVPPDGN